MIAEHEQLISDYLAGQATAEDVRRLEELVLADDDFRRSLLLEASMESHLRQTLGGTVSKLNVGEATASRQTNWLPLAAMVVVALIGWALAARFYHRSRADQDHVAELETRRAELQATAEAAARDRVSTDVASTDVTLSRMIDKRGKVLIYPEEGGHPRSLFIGNEVPEGHGLWTCPWGGAGTRYSDGTSVSLNRGTSAIFERGDGARRIRLRSGVLAVQRWPETPDGLKVVIETPEGKVAFERGLVTVAVAKSRTTLDVGMGTAQVTRTSDGQTIAVAEGQYVVIGGREAFRPVDGILRLSLAADVSSNGSSDPGQEPH